MARGIHRLSAAQVCATKLRGHHSDGGGLYLQVSKWNTKSWVFKFTVNGRTRGMGLGPIYDVTKSKVDKSLAEAREAAADLRKAVREGRDPIEERNSARLKARLESANSLSFEDAIEKYLVKKDGELSNERHRKQWRSTLDTFAVPTMGKINVAHITMLDVLRVLKPIWSTKTETASRLRGRIEAVLSWCTAAGYRTGDNPARWAGNLKELLPKPSALVVKENQPALPLSDLAAWFGEVKKREGMAARALEFLTLCASRSGEVRGAKWCELDLDARLWVIPASRMKAKKEHRVPLTEEAVALLLALPKIEGNDFVFPAVRGGALSDMSISAVMRRMQETELLAGRKGWIDARSGRAAVPHGLRSTFRDWTAEIGVARELAEISLAHVVGSEVERAYRRTDMLQRRRALMTAWSAACCGKNPGNVIALREAS